jgi:hypothetical protein
MNWPFHFPGWMSGSAALGEEVQRKGIGGVILALTQLFTVLAPFLPLVKLSLGTLAKCLKSSFLSSILFKMRTFKNSNCRLRFMAFSTADIIIDLIQQKPGGFAFWSFLPRKGRNNRDAIRKKIADTLLTSFYDDKFISILLKGALDDKGKPQGDSTLYHWLLSNVYSDNIQRLYNDWLRVSKKEDCSA